MLYKIKEKKVEEVNQTKFKQEEKLEEDLEDWIENRPSIIEDNLLIIGRQVLIPEVNDKIDLLALDTDGNVVIIELKKGKLKDPVDIQALRYASYVSRWGYEDLEKQANNYFSGKGEKDFNFNEKFEEFCSSAGIDKAPDLNQDQKIIIVGSKLKEKLGSVALWLRGHSINIRVIEVSLYKDGENLYLSPQVIIPVPTTEKFEIGRHTLRKDRPWLSNGEDWHLNKICGGLMKEKLMELNRLITENFETVEGPNWNQKLYVSFKEGNRIWIYINTHKKILHMNISIRKGDIDVRKISGDLGIKIFDVDSSLSEKLRLESSVGITDEGKYDLIGIRIKEDFNIVSEEFLKFLKDCFDSYHKVG
ncbi:MAG: hypothetical protein A7316_07425 [Candidatus Altiarchaeales archaeon WOR_SM1_86-2]|nr:MAG: hypothetical protein A7316_07425 [Candidatus Altiarchaeales archaeon WOR_SM1_86-2]